MLKKDGDGKENETDEKDKTKGKDKDEPRTVTVNFDRDASKIGASGNRQMSLLMLSKTISKGEEHPVRGDLVKFEHNKEDIFGYVEECVRSRVPRSQDLSLTYLIKTRKLSFSGSREITMTTVLPIGPYLRFVKAMDDLNKSPLFQSVMKPKVEDYEMLPAEFGCVLPLVTGHILDSKQLEVVARVVTTVAERSPKICLIQGPPGTGKSKVILNIISEVLKKSNTKILLCAPSNRAIDEVLGNLIAVQKERAGKRN